MDIDLLCGCVGACYLSLCVQTPQILPKTLSLLFLVVLVFYLRIASVRNRGYQISVRKCLLSGKFPPPNIPATTLPVTTTKVDTLITEVISLSLRDFVFSWFSSPLANKTQTVSDIATSLSWQIVHLTQLKLNEVDMTTLISQDVMIKLHSHFKTIRDTCKRDLTQFTFKDYLVCCEGCRSANQDTDIIPSDTDQPISAPYTVPRDTDQPVGAKQCCQSGEKKFLKRTSIVLLQVITPPSIWLSPLFTQLIGDVLANHVLYPLVEKISDPYYLYEQLLPYTATITSPVKDKKFFTQAKTYEDFIKKINKETDLNKLRQLRYKVIAEIMQAMTIENLKQGEDFDGLLSQINSKSYRLSTRNLNRYIKQCKVAKGTCEKRIHCVTRDQKKKPHYADMRFRESETKLLELDEILHSPYVIPFFVQYLEKQDDYGPLKLWLLIEQCKLVERRPEDLYIMIQKGYLEHLTVTSPLRAHQVSRHLIRMAEAYVERKSDYWQFIYEIQEELYNMLLEQHYKPFLISSQYMQYVCSTEGRTIGCNNDYNTAGADYSTQSSVSSESDTDSLDSDVLSEECCKVNALKEELKSKEVLLETLDVMNYCSAEELGQLREEIANLRVNINQMEQHTESMALWWEYLGRWEAVVNKVELQGSGARYEIIVQRKPRSCQQIMQPFNGSKFKLTQFNLNQTTEESRSLTCICAKRKTRRTGSKARTRSKLQNTEHTPDNSIGTDSNKLQTEEQDVQSTRNNETRSADFRVRNYSEMSRSSFQSLDPAYFSLQQNAIMVPISLSDTPEYGSVSTLMLTPSERGLVTSSPQHYRDSNRRNSQTSGEDSESVIDRQVDSESNHDNTMDEILAEPTIIGNSMFYRSHSTSSDCATLVAHTDPVTLLPVGEELCEPSELEVDLSSPSLSELEVSSPSLSELEVSSPSQEVVIDGHHRASLTSEDTISVGSGEVSLSRLVPIGIFSDQETISASSQDFPHAFPFDDLYQYGSETLVDGGDTLICSGDNHSGDVCTSAGEKVAQYLDHYAPDMDQYTNLGHYNQLDQYNAEPKYLTLTGETNQCDDDKLRLLAHSTLSHNVSDISLEEDSGSPDSSVEDSDPYLVIDIQSLPNTEGLFGAGHGALFGAEPAALFVPEEESAALKTDRARGDPTRYDDVTCCHDNAPAEEEEVHKAWVIYKSLEQLKSLWQTLKGYKSQRYPPYFPVPVPRDEYQVPDNKEAAGDFLNFVLRDRSLTQSEYVYRFFNPSCEQLYKSTQTKKKVSESEDDKTKDSIAIPFYTLIGEIFELHGHLQWLRRQIIYLVRITFGSTIERQIYRAMTWAGSEQQVFWYIQTYKAVMWGNTPLRPLTRLQKEEIRAKVRMSLLNTPPHLLTVLFGAGKTRKGLAKILDTFEIEQHSKHCLYTIIELALLHCIGTAPE